MTEHTSDAGHIIRLKIASNLAPPDKDLDIRVQPDPFEGWRIVVVTDKFSGLSMTDRKVLCLAGLSDLRVQQLEMLTPLERTWSGPLPLDSELDDIPVWSQALARETTESVESLYPSDLDTDLKLPIRATFYSLRGGVGRSTALAYTAKILAAKGRKVVCVDMDLEAPGLAALFGVEEQIRPEFDLVHLLLALEQGSSVDISQYILQVKEGTDLYCLPAGTPTANYARLLDLLAPTDWYREENNPFHILVNLLSEKLPFQPDAILFDSRTGIAPYSSPLLFDLCDLAIITFFPHPQSKLGTGAIARALTFAKTLREVNGRKLTPEPRFIVGPIPSSRAPEVLARYELRALEWISQWLDGTTFKTNGIPKYDAPGVVYDKTSYDTVPFNEREITHFVTYGEAIATSDTILEERIIWENYGPVAEWIERFLPSSVELESDDLIDKKACLEELKFSSGVAEQQEDIKGVFLETEIASKALSSRIPLVLGRKGTGKTAIFRHLLEVSPQPRAVVTAPAGLSRGHNWLLSPDGYKEVENLLREKAHDWSAFWTYYITIACMRSRAGNISVHPELEPLPNTELEVIEQLAGWLSQEKANLIGRDCLIQIDTSLPETLLLLFDGLDTGFGSTDVDRIRRRHAVEGLFHLITDLGERFVHLQFKVLLRDDIWRGLKFENKSHLFGRSVSLDWRDQSAYFKVALKQAKLSPNFSKQTAMLPPTVESWGEKDVAIAWNLLVGERMKGGKTAFTRNWVWNRLADANRDHSPRSLLQMLQLVVIWEREEQKANEYDRSILRPRGLIEVLPKVSEHALSALRDEEFPELGTLMDKLTELGRTPVDADELAGYLEFVPLAIEVGLIGIYEASEQRVARYMVPEIYRYALGMARRGPA